jgi:hypothetical protein
MEDYLQGISAGGGVWLSSPTLLGFYPPVPLQYYEAAELVECKVGLLPPEAWG